MYSNIHKHIVCSIIACFFILSEAAFAEPIRQENPTVGDLYRAFETVVFGSEFGTKKTRKNILKWNQPLRVSVQAYGDRVIEGANQIKEFVFEQIPVTDLQFDVVQKHLSRLTEITNLPTEDYKSLGSKPNITIKFVPQFQMANPVLAPVEQKILRRWASENGCYFILTSKKNVIDHAIIIVNSERSPAAIDHCVLEELTQILGLPNDNKVAWASVFSSRHKVTALSDYDQILLKTLYDPKIPSGMARKEAMRQAFKIITHLHNRLPSTLK